MDGAIVSAVRRELKQAIDEKTKGQYSRYFKEDVSCYGVKTVLVSQIAKRYYREIKSMGKKEIFNLCEELLKSDYCEEAFIAFDWAYREHHSYSVEDFGLFERWLTLYVNNWAKCDTFCNHAVGSLVEQYPHLVGNLKQWTKSDNRWLRRAAAVTLIIPAKKGMFLADIFEIADLLLEDKDDLVQKGYGWMLKDASIKHREEVFNYVMKNKRHMPRTALRYAIERMPDDMKRRARDKNL